MSAPGVGVTVQILLATGPHCRQVRSVHRLADAFLKRQCDYTLYNSHICQQRSPLKQYLGYNCTAGSPGSHHECASAKTYVLTSRFKRQIDYVRCFFHSVGWLCRSYCHSLDTQFARSWTQRTSLAQRTIPLYEIWPAAPQKYTNYSTLQLQQYRSLGDRC